MFVDAGYRGFLYNPVNQLLLPIPKLHDSTARVMWDAVDWGVFVTTDNRCATIGNEAHRAGARDMSAVLCLSDPPSHEFASLLVTSMPWTGRLTRTCTRP